MGKTVPLVNKNDLWPKVQGGDVDAFEEIFHQHYEKLVRYVHRFTQQTTVSEEIVQEVFISLWERRMEIKITSSLQAYLYRSAKNRTINYIKHQLPREQATTDITDENDLLTETHTATDNSEGLAEALNRAIQNLPEKCRAIFLLSRNEGLTYKEIAQELDISVKTVENQISIALKKIKKEISPLLTVALIMIIVEIVDYFLGVTPI